MWRLDVRALGFANLRRHESSYPRPTGPVGYLGGGQIVVNFVTRVATEGLPQRDRPDASLPFRLHALFVDAATGKVNTDSESPTASGQSCPLRSTGGKFVVFTPDKLLLYSAGLELLNELSLPLRSQATWESWWLFPSPGGRYLLIRYDAKSNASRDDEFERAISTRDYALRDRILAEAEEGEELIDMEELKILRTWTRKFGPGDDFLPSSISDEGLLVLKRLSQN